MKQYKFKNVKYSVIMNLLSIDEEDNCYLENAQYKGLLYKAKLSEIEEIEKGEEQ